MLMNSCTYCAHSSPPSLLPCRPCQHREVIDQGRRHFQAPLFSAAMLRALACLATAGAVVGLGLGASGTSAQARCQPTESDAAGPIERLDAPRRAKIGTGHVLQGTHPESNRLRPRPRCRRHPVAGRAERLRLPPAGRGSVVTDRTGRFRFEGPVPASSGFRPPHIHIAVSHPAYEELLTRYVVRRGAKTGRITIVLTPFL